MRHKNQALFTVLLLALAAVLVMPFVMGGAGMMTSVGMYPGMMGGYVGVGLGHARWRINDGGALGTGHRGRRTPRTAAHRTRTIRRGCATATLRGCRHHARAVRTDAGRARLAQSDPARAGAPGLLV